nr:glycosyltransferase [Acinetobacter sp. TTH0-4]
MSGKLFFLKPIKIIYRIYLIKILYVITGLGLGLGLGLGGAERIVCNLADQRLSQENQVKIVYLTGDAKIKPNNDIELIGLNLNNLYDFYNGYKNLRKIIISFKFDVVHSHMIDANLLARLVRLTCPINKLICTAHSNDEGGKLRMSLYRITHNLADLTTNVSNDAKKFLN